jgi:hypothetical protein
MTKATCSVRECRGKPVARGLCSRCYGKAWRRGELPPMPPKQLALGVHSLSNVDADAKLGDCATCGDRVPVEVRARKGHGNFACMINVRERKRRKGERYRDRLRKEGRTRTRTPLTPEARRRKKLREKYGITPEDYEWMFAEQQGKCAICLKSESKLYVDHDHAGGTVRGLLCHDCNIALGWLRDREEAATSAAQYLRASRRSDAAS